MQATVRSIRPATAGASCYDARVADILEDGRCRLDDGGVAGVAVSCLVRPQAGDRVLVAACGTGERYVLAVLARTAGSAAELNVPGATELALAAPRVALRATEAVQVQSLRDVEVTAAGNLSLTARNLLSSVADAVIEHMRQCIVRAGTYALQAQSLLRLHGRQAVVTAEEDVRIDGERISLG